MSKKIDYKCFWAFCVVVYFLDQTTKLWILQNLPFNTYDINGLGVKPKVLVDGFAYIVHIGNTGAAWGMLKDNSLFLGIIAVFAMGSIYWFRKAFFLHQKFMQVIFGLLSGGIFGNFTDRILRGHVIDFMDVHLPIVNYRWPSFNVADAAICIGVGLYFISSFFQESPSEESVEKKETGEIK